MSYFKTTLPVIKAIAQHSEPILVNNIKIKYYNDNDNNSNNNSTYTNNDNNNDE